MENSLQNKTARIISTIFVPPGLTLLIFIYLALTLEQNITTKIYLIIFTLLFGFIIPIVVFITLRRKEKINDNDASIKEERTRPYFIGMFLSFCGMTMFVLSDANGVSSALWFCYIVNTYLLIIINKYWKISAHAIGAAIPIAVLIFINGLSAIYFTILLIVIGWARIKLKVHTIEEVSGGAVFGFAMTYLQLYLITEFFS